MKVLDEGIVNLLKTYEQADSTLGHVVDEYLNKIDQDKLQLAREVQEAENKIECLGIDDKNLSDEIRRLAISGFSENSIEILITERERIKRELLILVKRQASLREAELFSKTVLNANAIKVNLQKNVRCFLKAKGHEKVLLIRSLVKEVIIESGNQAKILMNPGSFRLDPITTGGQLVAGSSKWWD